MKPIVLTATCVSSILLFAATPLATHAAEIRTVALTGQQVPGAPDGTVFTTFGAFVVLNDAGQTAFRAGASDDFYYGSGIWSEGGGSLILVAAAGQQVPGLPDGVTYTYLEFPQHLVINDAGSVAFSGHFTTTPSGGYASGFWSSGAGGSALVVRSGEQAAGTPAGVVYSISDSGGGESLVMNDAGQTAFFAQLTGPGVDLFTNGRGVWAQRHGGLELVARTGNHAPGTPDGVNFGDIFLPAGPALNGLGQTAFFAQLTGPGVAFTNAFGIWSEGSGSLALVVRTGSQAPGMPDGAVFTSVSASELTLNAAGQTAFHGRVTGAGVDSTNNAGIWSDTSGSLALIVRSGTPAPGTPIGVNFRNFNNTTPPALNDAGQIAFKAALTGGGVDSTNDLGIWSGAPVSPALVARKGEHAPGTEDGVVFGDFRTSQFGDLSPLILNAAGQTAFVGWLTGSGISASNDFGIWATDRSGVLQLIARTGNLLEVAPGDFRTVTSLIFHAHRNLSTGNADGRPSAFNNLGQLAFHATFTDGTSGIFVSNRVAVPEPSTLLLLSFGSLAMLWRRKSAIGSSSESAAADSVTCAAGARRRRAESSSGSPRPRG